MIYYYKKFLCKNIAKIFSRMQINFICKSSNITTIPRNFWLSNENMSSTWNLKNLKIQVIGSGAHGAPASVILRGDGFHVLINCGEGTQRLINEHKIKWHLKNPHIFITNSSWRNMSGLMAIALSLQNSNKKQLHLHGPEAIQNVFTATNRFVDVRSLILTFMNIKTQSKYSEKSYEVIYVPLYPSTVKKLKQNISDSKLVTSSVASDNINDCFFDKGSDYYDHLSKKSKHQSKKKRSHSQVCEVKNQVVENYAMAYIFYIKEIYKLIINKCIELNVPVGPLLNKLKNGEDVVLENGNLVKSSDVVKLLLPKTIVIAVECPSENYLDSLLQESAFFKHQSGDIGDIASVVIHFTSSHLIENPKYKDWINRFPKETKHLFINEKNTCLGSIAIHRFQYKLHAIHPEIFPLLPTAGIPIFPRNLKQESENGHTVVEDKLKEDQSRHDTQKMSNIEQDKIFYKCRKNSFIKGETLCEVYLRSELPYDYSRSIVLRPHYYISEIEKMEGLPQNLKQLKSELENMKLVNESNNRQYPKFLFLGTGSSQSSNYRNPSGILVYLDEENYMLLDCGEGTYNQLVRFFGRDKIKEVLKKLNLIFISHIHLDHHIGLVRILKERKKVFDEETSTDSSQSQSKHQILNLLAPTHLKKWLNFFSNNVEDLSNLYYMIFTNKLNESELERDKLLDVLNTLNFSEIKTAKMFHCSSSYGVAFIHKSNWKLTYSGDTRPCENLVEIGIDSDILIHEATFDDSLPFFAKSKAHSTISEAIDIGKQMNAKFILLTHFSQRYSHLPLLDNYDNIGVGVAFDNMIVSLNQLPILPKLLPSMKCLLNKYYDMMVEKRVLLNSKRKLIEKFEESERKKAKNFA